MRNLLRFLLWTALIVGVLIGVARLTAIRWWRVPADDPYLDASIAPTLRGGDLIVLWRLTPPRFGDLVICPEPEAPYRVVIGRLVGEAGDHVKVEGPTVTINGDHAATEHGCRPYEFVVPHPKTGEDIEQECTVEALGGESFQRGSSTKYGVPPRPVDTTVPDGTVFLLSDNRVLPYDSRDYGPVDRSTCTETIVFRLVSAKGFFDEARRFMFIH